eukprot:2099562-Rhodomonas_salina.1
MFDFFISLRYAEANEESLKLKAALTKQGYTVYICDPKPGDDMLDEIANAIETSTLRVIMGSSTYGMKTTSNFSTHEELLRIMTLKKKKNKDFAIVKMCVEFEVAPLPLPLPLSADEKLHHVAEGCTNAGQPGREAGFHNAREQTGLLLSPFPSPLPLPLRGRCTATCMCHRFNQQILINVYFVFVHTRVNVFGVRPDDACAASSRAFCLPPCCSVLPPVELMYPMPSLGVTCGVAYVKLSCPLSCNPSRAQGWLVASG